MSYPKKKRLVLVTWEDAHGSMFERPRGKYKMYTSGWLIKKGKKWTTIASERTAGGTWRGWTRIPTNAVRRIEDLSASGDSQVYQYAAVINDAVLEELRPRPTFWDTWAEDVPGETVPPPPYCEGDC